MADSFLDQFGRFITALQKAVGGGAARGLTDFFVLRVHAQINRIGQLLPQALSRAAWPIRQRAPRPTPAPPRPAPPRPAPKPLHPFDAWRRIRLPRSEGWLIRKLPTVAPLVSYLQQMLAEPGMANLAATPRGRHLLRPLCRMLGITDCLPEPAPRDAPPGSFVATPTRAALAFRLPLGPPAPPVTDPWAAHSIPAISLFPTPAFCPGK